MAHGVSLAVIALVASVLALRAASDVLIPFSMALLLAVLSTPLVNRMHRRIPRAAAVGAMVAIVVSVSMAAAWFVTWCAGAVSTRSEFYRSRIGGLVERIEDVSMRFGLSVQRDLLDPASVVGLISNWVASFFSSLGQFVVFIFFFAFLLIELPEFDRKIQRAFPDVSAAGMGMLGAVSTRLLRFFSALSWISAATGLLTFVWCSLCGLDFAVLWGGLAFVLNYIPYFGSIVAVASATLVALLQFDGVLRPMLVLVGLLVIQNVLGSYLAPRAFGRSVSVSPLVVFFSMILWGWIWGPAGMLLSVPLTACIKILCENVPALRPLAVLLGPVSDLDAPPVERSGVHAVIAAEASKVSG